MSGGYSSDFSDTPVETASTDYNALELIVTETQLYWPATSGILPPLARVNDVTADSTGMIIKLPPANSATPGIDALITNRGLNQFEVRDYEENSLAFINPGSSIYFYVSDNSSLAGGWSQIAFGASSSTAQASSLAGRGLVVGGGVLNLGFVTRNTGHDYTALNVDGAKVINWTSGVGTLTLSTIAGYQSGQVFLVKNNGTGTLTVESTPTDTIDLGPSIQLQPTESCFCIASTIDQNWFVIGQGRSRLFGYTLLTKTLTGGPITLTPQEASTTVQQYQGALPTNAVVNLPPVVQIYFVQNDTTGTFSTTFTTGTGNTVITQPGDAAVLACDGVNVYSLSKAGSSGSGASAYGISIFQFGCKGNGSTDDTVNLNAALTFAATVATGSVPVDVDFDGGQCAISGQLDLSAGVGLRNGGLKALSGGSLSATVPMISIDSGNFKRLTSMLLDCNRQSAGIVVQNAESFVCDRVQVRNFVGYGIGTRSGNANTRFTNCVCEEWTVGDSGETDYTLRTAIGWDLQGLNFYIEGCVARYCLTPVKVNASGGGSAHINQLYVKNGSSGTVKPNLNGIWVIANGGNLAFLGCIVEDGVIEVDDAFAGTSFQNTLHRSTSDSTVVDCFHLKTSTANTDGGGLLIHGSRYQSSFSNLLVQQTTGAGTWKTSLLWAVYGNFQQGGSNNSQSALSRMPVPSGSLNSPGIAYDSDNIGWYRDTANNVRIGWSENAHLKFYLRTDSSFVVGDGTLAPIIRVDGAAGNNRGIELATGGLKRWSIYEEITAESGSNAGSNLNIGAWDDTGNFITTALSIERKTGLVNHPDSFKWTPGSAAPTGFANGEMVIYSTGNTNATIAKKGTDGTVRVNSLTLA